MRVRRFWTGVEISEHALERAWHGSNPASTCGVSTSLRRGIHVCGTGYVHLTHTIDWGATSRACRPMAGISRPTEGCRSGFFLDKTARRSHPKSAQRSRNDIVRPRQASSSRFGLGRTFLCGWSHPGLLRYRLFDPLRADSGNTFLHARLRVSAPVFWCAARPSPVEQTWSEGQA
jgi:hypothetical protein